MQCVKTRLITKKLNKMMTCIFILHGILYYCFGTKCKYLRYAKLMSREKKQLQDELLHNIIEKIQQNNIFF